VAVQDLHKEEHDREEDPEDLPVDALADKEDDREETVADVTAEDAVAVNFLLNSDKKSLISDALLVLSRAVAVSASACASLSVIKKEKSVWEQAKRLIPRSLLKKPLLQRRKI
jgi:hypothetical protein